MSRRAPSWTARARAVLAASLRAAARGFPRPGDDVAGTVHDARKELKRSASLARLFGAIVGARAHDALEAVNAARRAIGRARDLDVLPVALAKVHCGEEARTILLRVIEEEREHAREAHASIDVEGLTAGLMAASEAVAAWDLGEEAPEPLLEALRQTYRSAKRRGRLAWATGDADDLHDFRVRVVDLGHQVALFERVWPALIAAEVAELHKLRAALGDYHDLTVLGEFALSRRELSTSAAEAVAAAALSRRKTPERRARAQFARLFAERPGAFERRFAAYVAHPQKLRQPGIA